MRAPTHPGDILREIIVETPGLTQKKLAAKMGVSAQTINTLVNRRRSMTASVAVRLARALGTSPQLWMNLQDQYDTRGAKRRSPDAMK